MKTAIINHKKYTVERVFNMVTNYEFTDKNGTIHLVDGEDVTAWIEDENVHDTTGMSGEEMAILYARYLAEATEDGIFWWKVK